MAVKMAIFWFPLVLLIIGCNAAGEFTLVEYPSALTFSGSTPTPMSLLKEIFSASLGMSVEETSNWNGLLIEDPFTTPEAVVELYVSGVSSLGNQEGHVKFPLTSDLAKPDTFEVLERRIKHRFPEASNKLVNVKLSDMKKIREAFGLHGGPEHLQPGQHLTLANEYDRNFLQELENLKYLTTQINNGNTNVIADNVVDFYHLQFDSLHGLSDAHGPNSLQTQEAKKLLGDAVKNLGQAFKKAYRSPVLVAVVVNDVPHTRRIIRDTSGVALGGSPADDAYSADYAAIFNIILWFGVVFVFTLISIVYAIMDMDPGRDSIIYRMTTMRTKKDN